ncbi:SIMPL domain-containing protein [Desulfurivibrio dismutans]|uniref:SIMPL domain-containing protein n=1 Tax=Desulfurivibrio dismutans TaxID=1398908 RepID=UPI0023DC646D|nr:SIMPL domain-containing protein [Desulfurivibrio alkaliphilus]MDF1614474.1 SIMPL domain-containing protein [Desulfurivibrio alkaliphilus]
MKNLPWLLAVVIALLVLVPLAAGASRAPLGPDDGFTVQLSAWAEQETVNDLLTAVLVVERSGPDSARLAVAVANLMRRALGEADRYPEVKVSSAAYATQPVYQRQDGKNERVGWRVRQSLQLESTEVERAVELIGRLQAFDLQLTGLHFTVSEQKKERLRAALTERAVDAWRGQAEAAVKRLGGRVWRPHEVRIDDERHQPVQPLLRAEALSLSQPVEPAVEAGTSRLRVTVSGTAWGR